MPRKEPGIVRKTLRERLSKGDAPTRADIKRAVEPRIVPAAPTTFAPRATTPASAPVATPAPATDDDDASDYDADLDDTDLGQHVYIGMFPDGEIRISCDRNRVFLVEEQIDNLVDWLEDNGLAWTSTASELAQARARIAALETANTVLSADRGYPPKLWPNGDRRLICAFCAKAHTEVVRMVAGRDALICNECVGLCAEIIAQSPNNSEGGR